MAIGFSTKVDAGFEGREGHRGMEVMGGGEYGRIEIFFGEELAVVGICAETVSCRNLVSAG